MKKNCNNLSLIKGKGPNKMLFINNATVAFIWSRGYTILLNGQCFQELFQLFKT